MQATDKYKNSLGSLVVDYYKLKEKESKLSSNEKTKLKEIKKDIESCYSSLKLSIVKAIYKEINRLGLNKVVTDNQIELTKSDLLKEIVLPPKNYEIYIEKLLKDKDLTEKVHLVTQAKTSMHVSSTIRSIYELEENPAPLIHSYLLKRTITLLKENAEEKSKEYISLNNNIKKAINTLKETNLIIETIKGRFTVSQKSTAIFNPKTCFINTNEDLEKELNKAKRNLQDFIVAFLKANYIYNFSVRDISTYTASIFLKEKETDKIMKQYKKNDDDDNVIEVEASSNDDPTAKAMANDAINTLKQQASNQKTYIQSEIALLAYLYRIFPKYFSNEILTKEQLKEEETNCIKNFLNDKRFSNFNKSEVERTTANYRKTAGLRLLKSHLLDLSSQAQGIFIKFCCEYLETKYIKTLGEKK